MQHVVISVSFIFYTKTTVSRVININNIYIIFIISTIFNSNTIITSSTICAIIANSTLYTILSVISFI